MVDLEQPPHPAVDPDTEGYWSATEAGELRIARCTECRAWHHPPLERCFACGGTVAFEPVGRQGTVFSVVAIHQPTVPGYLRDLPYEVALVELDAQPGLRIPVRVPVGGVVAIGDRIELELAALPGSSYRIPSIGRPASGRPVEPTAEGSPG